MTEKRVRKVTSPALRVTDAQVLAHLARKGIDADYVEFAEDYSVAHPTAKFYRDRKSDRRIMVARQTPRVLPDGRTINRAWLPVKGGWAGGDNAYEATVGGERATITYDGRTTTWSPTITLDGKPVRCSAPVLATPPGEADDSALEWDYGVCKRRLLNAVSGLRELYVFDADPGGVIVIDPHSSGDLEWTGLPSLTAA